MEVSVIVTMALRRNGRTVEDVYTVVFGNGCGTRSCYIQLLIAARIQMLAAMSN